MVKTRTAVKTKSQMHGQKPEIQSAAWHAHGQSAARGQALIECYSKAPVPLRHPGKGHAFLPPDCPCLGQVWWCLSECPHQPVLISYLDQQPFQLWDGHVPATYSPGSALLGVMFTSILVFFTDTIFFPPKRCSKFWLSGVSLYLDFFPNARPCRHYIQMYIKVSGDFKPSVLSLVSQRRVFRRIRK